jgi:hypothetical protein
MGLLEQLVGPRQGGDGSRFGLRAGKTAETVVGDAHGHFHEAVSRGYVFSAVTPAAGVALGTALSTTPPIALWNPPNSGVILSVLVAEFGILSGTLGVGSIFYAAVEQQTSKPTTGTPLAAIASLVGNQATPKGQAFQGSTLSGIPIALDLMASIAANPTGILQDKCDGEHAVLPGAVLCLQEIGAAGTSPLGFFSLTWEEIALL